MLKVGLTGGIGSGKSSVRHTLKQHGVTVIDADIVAREVVEPGTRQLQLIAEHFGQSIINADDSLNRAKLREIIFSNPEEKRWLESLLHPVIRVEIVKQLEQAGSDYTVLESPLLLETNQSELVERIVVVDVPEPLQIERASARDKSSAEDIQAIIRAQMPRAERLALADDVIDNSGSPAKTAEQVLALHQKLKELARHDR